MKAMLPLLLVLALFAGHAMAQSKSLSALCVSIIIMQQHGRGGQHMQHGDRFDLLVVQLCTSCFQDDGSQRICAA
jgi:hypothetical protein